MNLVDLIQATGGLPNDAAGIVAALNVKNIPRANAVDVGFRGITQRYGTTFTATAMGKLKAASASNPLLDATYIALASSGINFADPITQGMIETLRAANVFTDDEAAKLRAIGVWNDSLADSHNGGVDYTEAEVTAALAEIALRQNEADNEQWIAMVRNEFINPSIRTLTKAEIAQAFVDAAEE